MIESVPNQEPGQIRFRDADDDTVWVNLYAEADLKGHTVIVTMPYDNDDGVGTYRAYRQIGLTDDDRRALVRYLLPEATDIIERWERRYSELRGDRTENEDWHDEADDQEAEAWSEAAQDLRTALRLDRS